jgi:hypothetical protein
MACVPLTADSTAYTADTTLLTADLTEFCEDEPEVPPVIAAAAPPVVYFDVQLVPSQRKRKRPDYKLLLLG